MSTARQVIEADENEFFAADFLPEYSNDFLSGFEDALLTIKNDGFSHAQGNVGSVGSVGNVNRCDYVNGYAMAIRIYRNEGGPAAVGWLRKHKHGYL